MAATMLGPCTKVPSQRCPGHREVNNNRRYGEAGGYFPAYMQIRVGIAIRVAAATARATAS